MYSKAIEKLEMEINEKQNLINSIKNFENLSFSDKLQTVKQCELRYEREVMAKILQREFKSDILKNADECRIGVNNYCIKHDEFTFKVGFYNGKIIEIESDFKLIDENRFQPISISESPKDDIKIIEKFVENPSFKLYKSILPKIYSQISTIDYLMYFFSRKSTINNAIKRIQALNNSIKYQEQRNENTEKKLKENAEFKIKYEKYLKDIEQDLKYFEENDYSIYYKVEQTF